MSELIEHKSKKPVKERACKRLGAGAPKEEILARHKIKMQYKDKRRVNWHAQRMEHPVKVTANLKASHKNAGKHPSEAYA